jgi:hypothetical protein
MKLLAIIEPWRDELTISPKAADLRNGACVAAGRICSCVPTAAGDNAAPSTPWRERPLSLPWIACPPLGHQPGFRQVTSIGAYEGHHRVDIIEGVITRAGFRAKVSADVCQRSPISTPRKCTKAAPQRRSRQS